MSSRTLSMSTPCSQLISRSLGQGISRLRGGGTSTIAFLPRASGAFLFGVSLSVHLTSSMQQQAHGFQTSPRAPFLYCSHSTALRFCAIAKPLPRKRSLELLTAQPITFSVSTRYPFSTPDRAAMTRLWSPARMRCATWVLVFPTLSISMFPAPHFSMSLRSRPG